MSYSTTFVFVSWRTCHTISSSVSLQSNFVLQCVQNFEKLNSYAFPSYQNAESSFLLSGTPNTFGRPPPTSKTLFSNFLPLISLVRLHEESHTHGEVKLLPQFLSAYPNEFFGSTTYCLPFNTTVPLYSDFIPSACQYISNAFSERNNFPAPYPTLNATFFSIFKFHESEPLPHMYSG